MTLPIPGGLGDRACGAYKEIRMNTVPHHDDISVDSFSVKMKEKLRFCRDYKRRGGWHDRSECSQQHLSDILRHHVEKGDPVDVANIAMMLSMRGEGILPKLASASGPHNPQENKQ